MINPIIRKVTSLLSYFMNNMNYYTAILVMTVSILTLNTT